MDIVHGMDYTVITNILQSYVQHQPNKLCTTKTGHMYTNTVKMYRGRYKQGQYK